MLSRGRAFVRDLRSVFEKLDGERSKCPRCRGTGLLRNRKPWPWSRAVNSNSPCWFCEGIGAMPLYGLEGFFLGRSSTLFRTEDLKEPVDSPVKLHLCLGKYPDTRCQLKSCKPSKKMQELLDSQLVPISRSPKMPTSHLEYEGGHYNQHVTGEELHHPSEAVSTVPSVMSSLDPAGIFFHHDFDIRGKERAVLQLPIHLETWYLARKDAVNIAQRTANFVMSKTDFGHTPSPTSVAALGADSGKSALSQQLKESGYFEEVKGMKETPRRNRSTRRNQLRIKAEREAAQRALWRKKLKPSNSSETPDSTGPPVPGWSLSGSWKDLSTTWIAEETASARQVVESSLHSESEENQSPPNVQPERQALFACLVLGLCPTSTA